MSDNAFMEDETEHRLSRVIVNAIRTVLDMHQHPFQLDVTRHILKMMTASSNNPKAPVLLVKGTGGENSSACKTIGMIKAGVCLIIQNTLSLSSDQKSKINKIATKMKKHFINATAFNQEISPHTQSAQLSIELAHFLQCEHLYLLVYRGFAQTQMT